jgi:hypothetical protein
MLIWALPAWLGWALARVTVLAPYRLGYGTARVSGTAQGAGSEQKGVFCSESAPFCCFLNKTLVFVQIRLERGPLRGQFHESGSKCAKGDPLRGRFREGGSKCVKVGLSSRPVPRGAGSSSARGRLQFREERAPVPATALRQVPERRRGNLKMSGLNRIFMT